MVLGFRVEGLGFRHAAITVTVTVTITSSTTVTVARYIGTKD